MKKNEQIQFWRGEFGDEYRQRNNATPVRIRQSAMFFAPILQILANTGMAPQSVLEVGSNVGINLRALNMLTDAELFAVEPNDAARGTLVNDGVVPESNAFSASGENIPMPDRSVDFSFTSGVLIHVHPANLNRVCAEMYRVTRRVILCAEYFSASPEEISYRGNSDKLFKRDFGSFWLEQFPQMRILDYGFAWKPVTGLDNMTWWLFAKDND